MRINKMKMTEKKKQVLVRKWKIEMLIENRNPNGYKHLENWLYHLALINDIPYVLLLS